MKALGLLFLILSIFIYSCGGDSVSNTPDKCPDKCQENASCDTATNKCVCDEGFELSGEECIAKVVDKCKDKVCQDNATCNTTTGECDCDEGFEPSGEECITKVVDKCKDKVCQDNATCNTTTGECDCDEGFEPDGANCISTLCKGVTCTGNKECDTSTGECECLDGFIPDGDNCITDPCKDVTCGLNEVCSAGNCNCEDGYFYSTAINQCMKDKKCDDITCEQGSSCLSGTCYLDDECSSDNPTGVCPDIDNEVILVCVDGLCITKNEGNLQEGENCDPQTNECVTGTVCVDSFQNKFFKCRAFCDTNADDSCGEGVCAPYLDDYAQNTGICIKSDPECADDTDNCPEHFACAMMINARVCKAEGNTDLGEECDNDFTTTELEGCVDGTFCVGDEGDMSCQELCDPDMTDNCSQGRCINLQDIDASVKNSDIGLCLDYPYFCNTNDGAINNDLCENSDDVCLGDGTGAGMCFNDMCDPADDAECDADVNEKCTRSFTSKFMCIPAGDIGYGQDGCVNPQDGSSGESDWIPSKLCQKGLNCFQGKCVELCDPNINSNACKNDSGALCMDIHSVKADYPANINGVCVGMKK